MIGLEGVSAQALSDTIGAIYDCALDPHQWPDTCRRIAHLCESTAGGICVHDIRHVQNDQLFVFGYQNEFLEQLGKNYAQSPMAVADIVSNIGDVSALSMDSPTLLESRFFHEVLKPHGLLDIIWFPALRTGGRMASMHASRGETVPHYQERELALFKLLAPHVCRALVISDALDIKVLQSEMLERTLDALVAGVFLTARDGRVVYMNAAAERQIKSGKSISLVNDRLRPTDAAARAELSKAIDQAAHDNIDMDMTAYSLAIPNAEGTGYVATFLPVDQGQRRSTIAPFAASCAIFMQDPIQAPLMPGEAFARLYRLTAANCACCSPLRRASAAKRLPICSASASRRCARICNAFSPRPAPRGRPNFCNCCTTRRRRSRLRTACCPADPPATPPGTSQERIRKPQKMPRIIGSDDAAGVVFTYRCMSACRLRHSHSTPAV